MLLYKVYKELLNKVSKLNSIFKPKARNFQEFYYWTLTRTLRLTHWGAQDAPQTPSLLSKATTNAQIRSLYYRRALHLGTAQPLATKWLQ